MPEATQSVEIVEFVDLDQINPMYFDTPYYLEPEKKGRHAYALLRESLSEANKVGIARVVIRSREHLAALKPNGEALVLELMHFADELVAQSSFDFPELKEKVAPAELKVAKLLIDTMSSETFEPEKFHDEYREAVMAMIDARVAGEEVRAPETKRPAATNVVNLMDVLQRSLEQSKRGGTPGSARQRRWQPRNRPHRRRSRNARRARRRTDYSGIGSMGSAGPPLPCGDFNSKTVGIEMMNTIAQTRKTSL